jgi:hypothetical protein
MGAVTATSDGAVRGAAVVTAIKREFASEAGEDVLASQQFNDGASLPIPAQPASPAILSKAKRYQSRSPFFLFLSGERHALAAVVVPGCPHSHHHLDRFVLALN